MKTFLMILFLGFYSINGFSQIDTLNIDLNDSTKLILIKEKFNKDSRNIIYWDSSQQAITSIDNTPVYGTDATMPFSELTFAELLLNGKKIRLETTGMFDPWTEADTNISYEVEKFLGNPMKLKCLFSNGAGTYLVEWTIIGEKSYRTMITYDMKILDVINFKE